MLRLCKEEYTFVVPAWLARSDFLFVKLVGDNYLAKVFNIVIQNTFPSKAVARYIISQCGDTIEGKLVTGIDELKWHDCGNATEETEKDAEVEKSDYVDKDSDD